MRWRFMVLAALLAGCAGQAPVAPDGTLNVARAALEGGSPELAMRLSGAALAQHPDDTAALQVQGEALTAQGRTEAARAVFTRLLQREPQSVAGQLGLGRILLASDAAGAERHLLAALAQDPRNAAALNDLGIARDLQGHHADAQTAYRRALGVAPQMQAAVVNLALSLALSGQAQDGMILLRPIANAATASPKVHQDLAVVATLAGDRATAEAALCCDLSPADRDRALQAFADLRPAP
jgi:Flp pilus assembly protein TadD